MREGGGGDGGVPNLERTMVAAVDAADLVIGRP
jgi:hypothetical protein